MDDPLVRLAALIADPRTNLNDPENLGAVMVATANVSAAQNWHYLHLLCLSDLRGQKSAAAQAYIRGLTKQEIIEALIANHRINEALHLQLSEDEADPTAGLPLRLPARRWNLAGTDRWVSADDLHQLLRDIQARAVRIGSRQRVSWIAGEIAHRLNALTDRLMDAALMLLMRHAGALNGMQWRRLTKQSWNDSVQVRLHYATGFLTASVRVKGITARKTSMLPLLFAPELGETARRRIDAHFAARIMSREVFALLLALRTIKGDPLPTLKRFYNLLLADLMARPNIARAIETLGPQPTLVVATHGALAQVPFAALHDGRRFLCERFNVVQAPPIYAEQPFATGEIDYEAMVGGDPIEMPRSFRVMADTNGLLGARKEVEHYRTLATHGVDVAIRDGTTNEPWSASMIRDVVREPGIALLSCHMAPSPRGVSETEFLTPDRESLLASDIINAPLRADLLVLAGCVSLAKTDWFGEIEDSLASRFRRAGVQSVITTLWHVSDEAARRYNQVLVSGLSEGLSRAAAHGQAQRALLHAKVNLFTGEATTERKIVQHQGPESRDEVTPGGNFSHPFYWAPFVLSGAWR